MSTGSIGPRPGAGGRWSLWEEFGEFPVDSYTLCWCDDDRPVVDPVTGWHIVYCRFYLVWQTVQDVVPGTAGHAGWLANDFDAHVSFTVEDDHIHLHVENSESLPAWGIAGVNLADISRIGDTPAFHGFDPFRCGLLGPIRATDERMSARDLRIFHCSSFQAGELCVWFGRRRHRAWCRDRPDQACSAGGCQAIGGGLARVGARRNTRVRPHPTRRIRDMRRVSRSHGGGKENEHESRGSGAC